MGGTDEITGLAVAWVCDVGDDRSVEVLLPDGTVMKGTLAEDFDIKEARDLLGRLTDLRGAYRQFAAFPGHAYASIVSVWDPEAECVR